MINIREYYSISTAAGGKDTKNIYPQSESMSEFYQYYASDSCWNIYYDRIPDFEPNLNYFKIVPKTKLTDFISAVSLSTGFLISSRSKKLFEQFLLPHHKFYHASLMYKKKLYSDYYYFHYISDLSENINYSQTEFFAANSLKIVETFKVKDSEELRQKEDLYFPKYEIRTNKYFLKSNHSIPYDIFHVSFIDTRTYISHRLKTALEEANITGIEIVPTDVI